MTGPDRDLDEYLKGDSALSRRYREASREAAPPELDAAILAQARVPLRRARPRPRPWFSALALAASLVLGVNLAWNVHRAERVPIVPGASTAQEAMREESSGRVAAAPAPEPVARDEVRAAERKAPAGADLQRRAELAQADAQVEAQESARRKATEEDLSVASAEARRREAEVAGQPRIAGLSAPTATGAAGSAAAPPMQAPPLQESAPPAPLSEPQKIDRLIGYVASLDGAVFIRNGKEHGPADAAAHMRLKLEKAGKRVQTADDFIRLCASKSYLSGEAYLIRFKDGRTRTAEDVLREQLAGLR